MKQDKYFLTGLAVLLSSALSAQSVKFLSQDEAVRQSLTASHRLAAGRARIAAAAAALREAKERRLPDLSVQGSYLRLTQPTVETKIKLGGSNSSSGGSSEGATSSTTVDQVVYGLVNLTLPIYSGGKIKYGIESASLLERAAQLDADADRDAVVENVLTAYNVLYKAQSALKLTQENLRAARQRTADFSSLEKNGLLARNDLLKSQLQESNIGLTLLDAENNVRIATVTLNLLTGTPEETVLQVDSASFQQTADAGRVADWEAAALQNRRDAQAVDLRIQASRTAVRAARADYLPTLGLSGGYVAADIHNVLTVTNAINAGIGFKYTPSSIWKTGARIEQAKARQAEAEANRAGLGDAIRQQVYSAYQDYVLSLRKIEVYDTAVAQASEAFRIVKAKNENSLATTTELLDADLAQLQSKLSKAYAMADAALAYSKLQLAAGTLTPAPVK